MNCLFTVIFFLDLLVCLLFGEAGKCSSHLSYPKIYVYDFQETRGCPLLLWSSLTVVRNSIVTGTWKRSGTKNSCTWSLLCPSDSRHLAGAYLLSKAQELFPYCPQCGTSWSVFHTHLLSKERGLEKPSWAENPLQGPFSTLLEKKEW